MKKVEKIGKIIFFSIMLMLGMTSICYADLVVSQPVVMKAAKYEPFFTIVLIIMAVLAFIALICALIGKINKSDMLFEESLKVAEQIFYYGLILVGVEMIRYEFVTFFMLAILPFAVMVGSLYFRINQKKKDISYGILIAGYLAMAVMIILV